MEALERQKRQKRTGATPKDRRRPVRPYDSWRAPDATEALESFPGVPASCSSLLEGVGECEEAGWIRCHSKGSASPSATKQLEGARPFLTGRAWESGGEVEQRVSYLE